jgi:hypothetical protein
MPKKISLLPEEFDQKETQAQKEVKKNMKLPDFDMVVPEKQEKEKNKKVKNKSENKKQKEEKEETAIAPTTSKGVFKLIKTN